MPFVSIYDVGSLGVIDDVPPESLPPEAWTRGENIRFVDGQVEKMGGYLPAFPGASITNPQHLLYADKPGTPYWVYGDLTDLFSFDGASHQNLTRLVGGPYGATADRKWQGTILGTRVIMNNSFDVPQAQDVFAANSKFVNLAAWDPTWKTRDIQSFRQFLVALNITKGADEFPHMVKWSHPADPGFLPASWDETNPQFLAGETNLTETQGELVTQRTLRDANILYKTDSVHVMQFIGGQFVFSFRQIFPNIDIIGPKAVETFGQRHIVLGNNGLYVHDGQNYEQILHKKRRRWLYANMNTATFGRTVIVRNEIKDEIWIIFPDLNQQNPNRVLIWNYLNNTFSDTVIEPINHAAPGTFLDAFPSATWDSDPQPWQQDATPWNQTQASSLDNGIFSAITDGEFARLDSGFTQNGQGFNALVERQGLVIIGRDWRGQPKVDVTRIKHVRAIYPKVANLNTDGLIRVSCGGQMHRDDPIVWQGPFEFNPATMDKVDFSVNGRYIAVRFEMPDTRANRLMSYDIDIDVAGLF